MSVEFLELILSKFSAFYECPFSVFFITCFKRDCKERDVLHNLRSPLHWERESSAFTLKPHLSVGRRELWTILQGDPIPGKIDRSHYALLWRRTPRILFQLLYSTRLPVAASFPHLSNRLDNMTSVY